MFSSERPDLGCVAASLRAEFPHDLADDWDNNGLLVGSYDDPVTGILIALECTTPVIAEAADCGASLIVTHHPLIFKPLRTVVAGGGGTPEDRVVRLLRERMALYAVHTPLDYETEGMFEDLAGWVRTGGIGPVKQRIWYKISVFVPPDYLEAVRDGVFRAGAGRQGDYARAGFSVQGTGSFQPLEGAAPFSGTVGEETFVTEKRFETIVSRQHLQQVLNALYRVHPYEEPAVDVIALQNGPSFYPGERYTIDKRSFLNILDQLKRWTGGRSIAFGGDQDKLIDEVWFFPGSGEGFIDHLSPNERQVLVVTGDIRYHAAQKLLENGFCFADIGHYGSEVGYIDRLARRIASIEVVRKFGLSVSRTRLDTDFLKNVY